MTRSARVCLVTTGQPSTNPRLVKEADALVDAGYQVHVIAAHWADWAAATDARLLGSRRWRMTLIDWRRDHAPLLFHRSRARHWLARKAAGRSAYDRLAVAALSRVGPELLEAATNVPAELYIAHNIGALPAACAAAAEHAAKVGFDAEDFHSGQLSPNGDPRLAAFTSQVERHFIPRCDYVTAASPGIAHAYRDLCGIELPTCVLNVFSLRDRPALFRDDDCQRAVRLYWFSQTIGPDRGLEDVVRAMGVLSAHPLELHLRGCWQSGYERRLRQLAVESRVAQNSIVSHDAAPPDEMVREASDQDVGLALEPPVSINNDILLSNKLFTYLLAGNGVVATRTRGQSQLMPELRDAAVWCDPAQPDSLAAALRPWLENRDALAAARRTAWHLGQTQFNWDVEKQKFVGLVTRTLQGGQSGTPPRGVEAIHQCAS